MSSGDAYAGSWAARSRATTTADPPSYAYRNLASTQQDLYCRLFVKVESQGANAVEFMKLRTASGTSLFYLLRTSSGLLAVRNNVTGVTTNSTTAITTGVWHQLEIHARVYGAGGASDAWLDGVAVQALSLAQNFGSTGIGRVELGNNTASRVYSALLDDVACSISFIP